MRRLLASLFPTLMFVPAPAIGQSDAPSAAHMEFEVASIKPAAPDARGMYIAPGPGGGIRVVNMTLKELIVIAYRVQPFQISGGPPWLDSLHYDIVAKPERKTTRGDIQLMIQSLLADRFQLTFQRQTKELPSMR